MNFLIKKEVRMLWPGWLAVLGLEAIWPWFTNQYAMVILFAPVLLFFGTILLAVDSFGREFSLGTFSALMSQPLERWQIWRTKVAVLAVAAGLVFVVFYASCGLYLHVVNGRHWLWHSLPDTIQMAWTESTPASLAAMVVALSGALWATLLLRQAATAFWISFLAPLGILTVGYLLVPTSWLEHDHFVMIALFSLAAVYSGAGFWLAHRLFYRAQDVTWTGGVVSFSRWRYFERTGKTGPSRRQRRPIQALLQKEFQLHSISLVCVGMLLVLHLGIIVAHACHGVSLANGSVLQVAADSFWVFWFIVPLVIGCVAVAEERKLGVAAGQFCLPASRRLQFAIKLGTALVLGVMLGSVLPVLLEAAAAHFGVSSSIIKDFFRDGDSFDLFRINPIFGAWLLLAGITGSLTLVAIYASSLTRSFLQALGLAVVLGVAIPILIGLASVWFDNHHTVAGMGLSPVLTLILMALGVPPLVAGLAYANFKYFSERNGLWARNGVGWVGGLGLLFVLSLALYNRAWEAFEPVEPAHGPAVLTLASPPKLVGGWNTVQVQLPDGRVWVNGVVLPFDGLMGTKWKWRWPYIKALFQTVATPVPKPIGAGQVLPDTDWTACVAQYSGQLETLGIRSDGTLWVSTNDGRQHEQLGTDTDWTRLVSVRPGPVLLKNNGTLWRMSPPVTAGKILFYQAWPWPQWNQYALHQVGTNANWTELAGSETALARQADGSVWRIDSDVKTHQDTVECSPNLNPINLEKYSTWWGDIQAVVQSDGALWEGDPSWQGNPANGPLRRLGRGTDWQSVAVTPNNTMVTLKKDGSLWLWQYLPGGSFTDDSETTCTRLGIHQDWVAIMTSNAGHLVSLAADGSLWCWALPSDDLLLKTPKQPEFLGNVLAAQ